MKIRINKLLKITFIILVTSLVSCIPKSGPKGKHQPSARPHYSIKSESKSNAKRSPENILPMETENGVKYIWAEINGLNLKFVFDTGASSICISMAEAIVLIRQGTLRDEDILNQQQFSDATGAISEGTKINLRTVKLGNKVLYNVEALIVNNNEAPLLLGQSVLERFGKISIDNKNQIIIFE